VAFPGALRPTGTHIATALLDAKEDMFDAVRGGAGTPGLEVALWVFAKLALPLFFHRYLALLD
jgi:hypothetical protein